MEQNELIDAAKEIGITALDTEIENLTDFFNGFPVIASALTLLKALASIPDRLYIRKMYAFLEALKSGDMDNIKFSKAMKDMNIDSEKFGTTLLYLIEKAENEEKAHLLGFFTNMMAKRAFSYDNYLMYVNVINNVHEPFLVLLSKIYQDRNKIDQSILYGILQSQGFVKNGSGLHVEDGTLNMGAEYSSNLDEFGKFLSLYFNK